MSSAWPHGDPSDVVRSVVNDARYHLGGPAAASRPSWLDALVEWLAALLRRLLHGLDHALGANSRFETAIGFVVIAAALALLGFAIYLLVRSYVAGRRARPPGGTLAPAALEARNSAELRAAAQRAALARRYREAAALLFLAAARALDERGRVAYDPARTPGEYRRLVREPLFDAFANDAVVAVFAAAEPAGDIVERMDGTYDQLFAGSVRTGAPPA